MSHKQVISEVEAMLELKYGVNTPTKVVHIPTKRALTTGEIKICKLIFKDAIDYSKVFVQVGGLISVVTSITGNAMTPAGRINLPTKEYYKTLDFSLGKANEQHWFIHEMTHVWQYQLGTPNGWYGIKHFCNGGYTSTVNSVDSGPDELKAYDTDLIGRDSKKKFNEFNFEQQGRIIEFWFDACYLQHNVPTRPHHKQSISLLPYVERVLRDFLHNPYDKTLLPRS